MARPRPRLFHSPAASAASHSIHENCRGAAALLEVPGTCARLFAPPCRAPAGIFPGSGVTTSFGAMGLLGLSRARTPNASFDRPPLPSLTPPGRARPHTAPGRRTAWTRGPRGAWCPGGARARSRPAPRHRRPPAAAQGMNAPPRARALGEACAPLIAEVPLFAALAAGTTAGKAWDFAAPGHAAAPPRVEILTFAPCRFWAAANCTTRAVEHRSLPVAWSCRYLHDGGEVGGVRGCRLGEGGGWRKGRNRLDVRGPGRGTERGGQR
jgi:hypothetical protein